MRGSVRISGLPFSHIDLASSIPACHPLPKIRQVVNDALGGLTAAFAVLCADSWRPSIAPERLIRASLLQILFPVRLDQQLSCKISCRSVGSWGWGIDDQVWGEAR